MDKRSKRKIIVLGWFGMLVVVVVGVVVGVGGCDEEEELERVKSWVGGEEERDLRIEDMMKWEGRGEYEKL